MFVGHLNSQDRYVMGEKRSMGGRQRIRDYRQEADATRRKQKNFFQTVNQKLFEK